MTAEQILAAEHERMARHNGYSVADLRQTFDSLIHPGQNWKGELFAVIDAVDLNRVKAAAEFFLGSAVYIQLLGGLNRSLRQQLSERRFNGEQCVCIRIPGYYASVGA